MTVFESADADTARATIRAQVAAAGTSFYWAMRLLPPARREAMFAIYAFCREVDDIADSDDPSSVKLDGLARWRREVDAIFAGSAQGALGGLLGEAARTFNLRRDDFIAIIDGMKMDATENIQAPTSAELDLYCDRVASAVGRLSVRIFGCELPVADRVAHALGRALQLTNILRDLNEDADRERLYLPRELLDRHHVALASPHEVLADKGIAGVCDDLADLAERHFAEAEAAMAACPRGPMRPAAVMRAVYHKVLVQLRRRGWNHLADPVRVSAPVKLWLALRYGLL